LHNDARTMLEKIVRDEWLQARAVLGLFAANSADHDDLLVYADDERKTSIERLCHLRQQRAKPEGQPQNCLADFVAPAESGLADFVGAFAVTAGIGIDERVAQFEKAHDDYNAILLKALADRLAEALAERMHERVRKEFWGYAPDENLANEQLIAEQYRGIRPAPGYPACPDHTEKQALWELIEPNRNAGIEITDSYAMMPASSVSGWYFSHPKSQYFGTGKIQRDQVEDYAERKKLDKRVVERWLAPVLGYDT